jgi:hypothetical protein
MEEHLGEALEVIPEAVRCERIRSMNILTVFRTWLERKTREMNTIARNTNRPSR